MELPTSNSENKPKVPLIVGPKDDTDVKKPKKVREVCQFETFSEQVKHYERKIKAFRKAKSFIQEAEAISNLGILFYKASLFEQAKACHDRHLKLAQIGQNERTLQRAFCNLGCTNKKLGLTDEAVECYEKGLQIAKNLNDKIGEGKLLNNLGNICEQRADFDKAVYYYLQRLRLAKELKDLDGESKACASLGNVYHIIGNIRESIQYYERLVACLKFKLVARAKKGIKDLDDNEDDDILNSAQSLAGEEKATDMEDDSRSMLSSKVRRSSRSSEESSLSEAGTSGK